MSKIKNILPWYPRIIISILFLLSAIAKLYPSPDMGIYLFEIKQLVPLGIDICYAPYFSRFLIATEVAIGVAILQPHFLKRFVVPVATLMLIVFSIHLTYTIFSTGNSGNCGCFGELIPMTPLQALIKNIIGIGLLVYLFFNCSDREKGKNSFSLLSLLYIGVALLMFLLLPFCPCSCNSDSNEVIINNDANDLSDYSVIESDSISKTDTIKTDTIIRKPIDIQNIGPKKRRSKYRQHVRGIDEGKKILCFFSPGCGHCQDAVIEISKLSKQRKDFPEVYIIFMDEEAEKIPQFIKKSGRKFSYKLMDIASFYGLMGTTKDTPGVVYLWNGNVRAFFDGPVESSKNAFTSKKLLKALDKKK